MTARRLQYGAAIAAAAGLMASLAGALGDWTVFLQAWHLANSTWLTVPLGALALLMTHNLTGGAWGEPCRAPLKAAIATLPVMVLAFAPLALGVDRLFPWAAPSAAADPAIAAKRFYLNEPFFYARLAFYALVWLGLAFGLGVWHRDDRRPRGASAAGLILWALTVTFFSFDWLMSLEPHWYSDIYGLIVMTLQCVTAMSVLLLTLTLGRRAGHSDPELRLDDLANLWLVVLLGWVFVMFSQYIIIWNVNLPHEISWYLHRSRGGWQWLGGAVFALFFLVPFLVLLAPAAKRSATALRRLTLVVLAGHVLQMYWLVMPAFSPGALTLHWLTPVAVATVGAVWLWAYCLHTPASTDSLGGR